jgi:WD40 repeat protein
MTPFCKRSGVGLLLVFLLAPFPSPALGEERPKKERTDQFGDPLPYGALARMGTVRFRTGSNAGQIAFTPESKILAAASHDGVISLWDAATGKELRRIEDATTGSSVAISRNGKILVTGYGTELRRWDLNTWNELARLKLKEPVVERLLFSPDGKSLALAGRLRAENQNVIVFLDAETGNELHRKLGQKNYIAPSFAFAPDSKTWAYADGKENAIWLFETATGKELRRLSGLGGQARAVTFTPDGKTLASVHSGGELRFWDAATGKLAAKVGRFISTTPHISFSPDGKFIAGNGIGRRPQLYELAADRNRYPGPLAFTSDQAAIFSPDGRLLAISGGNVIRVWDMIAEKPVSPWEGHQGDVETMAYALNGKMLVSSARSDMRYYLWDTVTGKELIALEEKHATANSVGLVAPNKASRGSITAVVASPDGTLLAIGSSGSGTIWLVDAATGKEIRRLDGEKDWIRGLALSADGRTLASQQANAICLWDIATGRKVNSIPSDVPGDNNIALSPDGKTVAQGDYMHGVIHLWDAAKGQESRRWKAHRRGVYGVAFSPDGAKLVSVGDHTEGIILWDVSRGAQLHRIEGHQGYVRFAVFSPDGRSILSGGTDKTVRMWEVASGGERQRFVGHRSDVVSGSFSPDGRQASTGSSNTTALVWDLFSGRESTPATLEENDLEALWPALEGADARTAFRASVALGAAGDRCLPILKKHLQTIVLPNAERLAPLLRNLDSEEFAVRTKAARDLEALGEGARPSLRKLLDNPPSEEARRRAEQILAKLEGLSRLRSVRAVEVVEHIATQDACELLHKLASGVAEASLTREAKAALDRLEKRPKPNPK